MSNQVPVITAGEIVRQAAALLRVHGWTKGQAKDNQGRLCLWGAILFATPQEESVSNEAEAVSAVNRVITEQYPERLRPGRYPEVYFNDNPVTTLDEVFAVLDKAAVLADEEAGE